MDPLLAALIWIIAMLLLSAWALVRSKNRGWFL